MTDPCSSMLHPPALFQLVVHKLELGHVLVTVIKLFVSAHATDTPATKVWTICMEGYVILSTLVFSNLDYSKVHTLSRSLTCGKHSPTMYPSKHKLGLARFSPTLSGVFIVSLFFVLVLRFDQLKHSIFGPQWEGLCAGAGDAGYGRA